MAVQFPSVQSLVRLGKRSVRAYRASSARIYIEELEQRVLLASALLADGKLVFNNDTDGEQNDLTLSLADSGRGLMLRDTGSAIAAGEGLQRVTEDPHAVIVPWETVSQIEINLHGGDDTLTVDFTAGNPIPAGGLVYDGGE